MRSQYEIPSTQETDRISFSALPQSHTNELEGILMSDDYRNPQLFKPWTLYDYIITGVVGALACMTVGYFIWAVWG